MENCNIRIVYRSENATFYESVFIDRFNKERSFYCVIAGSGTYSLTKEEGQLLEKTVMESFQDYHCEGIEITLVHFSSFHCVERLN